MPLSPVLLHINILHLVFGTFIPTSFTILWKYFTVVSMYTVIIEIVTVITGESTEAVLKCEVYGYPRNSSPPVWTHGSDELHNGRYTTTVTNAGLLSGNSISTTERVVSQLTITNVTVNDSGDYTCSWQGNSTTVTLRIAIIIGESIVYKCKNIFTKMLKDVGMEVPKSIETRSKFSMHADKGSMQQS